MGVTPRSTINSDLWTKLLGSGGSVCRYFFMQFSPGLRGARRDIERIELNGASCQERTELINAYVGRHS